MQEFNSNAWQQVTESLSADHALTMTGLTKRFAATVAVDALSLTVPRGSFFGLVGPNGAGKTTALSMAVGCCAPTRARPGSSAATCGPTRSERRSSSASYPTGSPCPSASRGSGEGRRALESRRPACREPLVRLRDQRRRGQKRSADRCSRRRRYRAERSAGPVSAEALHGDQQGNASATVARRAVSPVTRGQRHDPASAHPTGGPSTDPGTTGDVAAPLDLLLTTRALGPTRRFFPGASGLRFTRALASQPRLLAACVGGLAAELGRVVAGTSQVAPSRRDRRFTDPAWTQNPSCAGSCRPTSPRRRRRRRDWSGTYRWVGATPNGCGSSPTTCWTCWRRATTRCSVRSRRRP